MRKSLNLISFFLAGEGAWVEAYEIGKVFEEFKQSLGDSRIRFYKVPFTFYSFYHIFHRTCFYIEFPVTINIAEYIASNKFFLQ